RPRPRDLAALPVTAAVVDTHTHSRTLLPGLAARSYRVVTPGRPADVTFAEAHRAGVDAIVAKAVGDPIVTRWHLRAPFQAVRNQLAAIRAEATDAGAVLATTADGIRAAKDAGRLAVVLGLEGADAVGTDLGRL